MGIRGLNKFLQENCKNAISKKLLYTLKNKTVGVDANNYLYKFLMNGELIPNLYEFCVLLKYYNIKPVFVFDGEPPKEKLEVIEQRRENRKNAQEKYEIIKNMKNTNNIDSKKIEELRRDTLYLSNPLIKECKILLQLLKIEILIAPSEADEYLCQMVKTNKAYAVMSEDMDLFVYGCPRIIRYVSIMNHNCIMYEIESILTSLNISLNNFKMICIMCGTDYNKKINNIYKNYNTFTEFKNENNILEITEKESNDFINYVESKNNISNLNFTNIMKLFEISSNNAKKSCIFPDEKTTLRGFLEKYNFIFPN